MSSALKILIRVVKRRVTSGEKLQEVLKDYPKLTTEEVAIVENDVLAEETVT